MIASVFTKVRFDIRSGIPGHITIITSIVNEARSAIGANRTVLRMPNHITFRLVGEHYREAIASIETITMRGMRRDVLTSKPLHIGCVVCMLILKSGLRIDSDTVTCLPCTQLRLLASLYELNMISRSAVRRSGNVVLCTPNHFSSSGCAVRKFLITLC